ncbi:MAG: type II secretion system protein GspI [Deltaproteobacteria bacterium]|nr:type II secretion system protein GspI [Deltaproteobacteria bacterium]
MRVYDAGFTLLEVMVAMSILALALVAVFQLQSQSIAMSTSARFMTTASLLAQSKMADVEAGAALGNMSGKGDFAPDFPEYQWTLQITDTKIPKLKRIEVNVFHSALAYGNAYQLVFYKTGGM